MCAEDHIIKFACTSLQILKLCCNSLNLVHVIQFIVVNSALFLCREDVFVIKITLLK